jgi:hypothetical protein
MDSHGNPSSQSLIAVSASIRENLIDQIVDPKFLQSLFKSESYNPDLQRRIAFELRSFSKPLRIPFPEPVMEVRHRAWGYAACCGAIFGMMLAGGLTHYLFGDENYGILIGGPLGALVMVLVLGFLVKRPRLLRSVQVLFGVASLWEVGSLLGVSFTPMGLLWNQIKKKFTKTDMLTHLKRISVFVGSILILQFAVPKAIFRREQLEVNAHEAITAWLDHHTDVLYLLWHTPLFNDDVTTSENFSPMPTPLLNAIQMMTKASDQNLRELADEVIQEFKNAGYKTDEILPDIFTQELEEKFDIVGLIQPGDSFKILDSPIMKDGVIFKKGRITKMRKNA